MSEEEINFTKPGFFGWLDRVLFGLIILCHAAVIFDFVKDRVEKQFTPEIALIGYVILVTFFWTVFLTIFTWRQIKESYKIGRLKGYVAANKWFHLAFALLRQVERELNEAPKDDQLGEDAVARIMNQFEMACSHVAAGFRTITGNEVSVCIKLMNEANGNGSVKTFLRDSYNVDRNYHEDELTHPIESNTSYTHVFQQISRGKGSGLTGRYFFNNDLPQLKGYKNSSFAIYKQETYPDSFSSRKRNKRWKMPYKSTIVTGIYPNQKQYFDARYITGFLCIDSEHKNSFNEALDTPLLTGVADTLYNSLKTFGKLTRL